MEKFQLKEREDKPLFKIKLPKPFSLSTVICSKPMLMKSVIKFKILFSEQNFQIVRSEHRRKANILNDAKTTSLQEDIAGRGRRRVTVLIEIRIRAILETRIIRLEIITDEKSVSHDDKQKQICPFVVQ